MNKYKKTLIIFLLFGLILVPYLPVKAASPNDPMIYIRDLTRIEGIRENMLQGFGLVVGLDGSGDSRFSPIVEMLKNMLYEYGIVADDQLKAKNVAAVSMTAILPSFAREGDSMDVTVQSIGDAKSLQGGTLLMTALYAPNGQVFAAAQGSISIGGFSAGSGGNTVQKNHLQVGRIPNGVIIERTLEPDFSDKIELDFLLKEYNYETATLIVQAVNDHFKDTTYEKMLAKAVNAGRIRIKIPVEYQQNVVGFIAQIQGLQVRASMRPKIVINERTGTIVIGHNVRISTVAVAHGNLTVTISTQETTTSNSDDDGNTETNTTTDVQVNADEEKNQLLVVPTGATIGDLVEALNAIGVTPRDIIAILQAMKEVGALYAEFELM